MKFNAPSYWNYASALDSRRVNISARLQSCVDQMKMGWDLLLCQPIGVLQESLKAHRVAIPKFFKGATMNQ